MRARAEKVSEPVVAISGQARSENNLRILVKKLVHQAASSSHDPAELPSETSSKQKLLDIEVDGIRCVLTTSKATPNKLSPREQEIARMVAEGYPTKTIAALLEISSWTVSTHLRRMFAKLGVGSRAAMIAKLLESGSHPRLTIKKPTEGAR
jgi:DNA-binding CsgD family transcriptional regulator